MKSSQQELHSAQSLASKVLPAWSEDSGISVTRVSTTRVQRSGQDQEIFGQKRNQISGIPASQSQRSNSSSSLQVSQTDG